MNRMFKELTPFIRRFRSQWGRMALGTLLGLVTVASSVGLRALSGWFISAAAYAGLSSGSAHLFNFFFPSIGVRIFAFARTLGRYGDRIVSHDATFRILEQLRVWFYGRIEPIGPGPLGGFRSGDLLSRIVSDIDALDNLYLRVIQPSVVALILAAALPLFLLPFDPWIAFVAGSGLVAAGFGIPVLSGRLGADTGSSMTARVARLRTRIVDGIQGAPDMIVFGASARYLNDLREENRKLIDDQRRMSHIRGFSGALMTLISGLTVGIVLWLGSGDVLQQWMDGPRLTLAVMATLAAFEGVVPLPAAYQFLGRTQKAAARLLEIVHTPVAVRFPAASGALPQSFDLTFEAVGFQYAADAPPALDNFSLHIPEGGRVVVLGETGAGKTTLVNLLVRFWDPTKGRILIGGRDIRSYSETDLRRLVSVVPQQPHLFNASIRDNLRIARKDASEVEMKTALAVAKLLDVVEALPEGLDTWVGEGGRELSGGQARRLSVARAVLHDAPIWVLDEATEGLDTVTEAEMTASLYRHIRGKTLIVITHRLSLWTLMRSETATGDTPGRTRHPGLQGKAVSSDIVVMLDKGRIVGKRFLDFSF
ncbi:MAG: thiol reductant ABC exporter subunit CydC [Desulfococcus multivorans]|jgi:ATP-binding cassette subfamily C protein CydC|nr:thiol reductant ABC exporter subunit CydC [Desulfococcus multivorans]